MRTVKGKDRRKREDEVMKLAEVAVKHRVTIE